MRSLRIVVARFRALFRRDGISAEIREEMQFHVDMRAEEFRRGGLAPDQAARTAARRFGNLTLMQDRGYDIRGAGVIESVLQDLRFAVRLLRKDPAFSTVAVLTVALGIGASTSLVSIIDAALLRPLPYPDPEQLVVLRVDVHRNGRVDERSPSLADINDWRASHRVVSHVGTGTFVIRGRESPVVDMGVPERVVGGSVSDGLLETFGIRPARGRLFTYEDTLKSSPRVALLGHDYWRTRFGGVDDAVGRVVSINGQPTTIVGVLPADFYAGTGVWLPAQPPSSRRAGTIAIGRLRPGTTLTQAQEELTAISRTANDARADRSFAGVRVLSLYSQETGRLAATMSILTGAVAFILLIACINVAGLLLARGTRRAVELGVRASIGASRWRLVRQLLTESVLLAVSGGCIGVFMAWASLDAVVALIPMSLPTNSAPAINLHVLVWATGTSCVSAVACGLIPAMTSSRIHLPTGLAAAGWGRGVGLSRRGGQFVIATEVALTVILLGGAGLMVRSFDKLLGIDLGFEPDRIVTMDVEPVDPAPAVADEYYPALLARIRAMPQVAEVGAIDSGTFQGGWIEESVTVGSRKVGVIVRHVLPGYFEALGLQPTAGRVLTEADRTSGDPVVVMTEEAARQAFPGISPVGRMLPGATSRVPPRRVIGVVPDLRPQGPFYPLRADVFQLADQNTLRPMDLALTVVMQPRVDEVISEQALQQLAHDVGPKAIVGQIRSGSEWFNERIATPRQRTFLLGLLAGFALLLTVVGIFSVTAYAVAHRTHEIGIRLAFGARPADVVRRMVADAGVPLALGLAMGLGGAYFCTAVVATFLFQTTPRDPVTFVWVALLMVAAALLAAWLPARRAARVDPVIALRAD